MSDLSQPITLAQLSDFTGEFKPLFDEQNNDPAVQDEPEELKEAPPIREEEQEQEQEEEEDAFELGFEAGQKAAADKFSAEKINYQRLISNMEALQPEPSDELAILIGETVEALVRQIVGEFTPDADWLKKQIDTAARMISDCDAARTIWMHPDDINMLNGDVTDLALMPDMNANRGSVRVDCSAGWIESGTALYLDELRNELGLGGVSA